MSDYAVVEAFGSQHRVQKGQVIRLAKIEEELGSDVEFDNVLLVKNGEDTKVGNPFVPNSKVIVEIISHGRDKKVRVLKFKRRKGYLKKIGHRQWFTEVKIKEIK